MVAHTRIHIQTYGNTHTRIHIASLLSFLTIRKPGSRARARFCPSHGLNTTLFLSFSRQIPPPSGTCSRGKRGGRRRKYVSEFGEVGVGRRIAAGRREKVTMMARGCFKDYMNRSNGNNINYRSCKSGFLPLSLLISHFHYNFWILYSAFNTKY